MLSGAVWLPACAGMTLKCCIKFYLWYTGSGWRIRQHSSGLSRKHIDRRMLSSILRIHRYTALSIGHRRNIDTFAAIIANPHTLIRLQLDILVKIIEVPFRQQIEPGIGFDQVEIT